MEMSLLDYLVRRTCLSYISDLRFHPLECALALRSLDDPGAFSLEDWNRSGSYLSSLYSPPKRLPFGARRPCGRFGGGARRFESGSVFWQIENKRREG